jgi:hypothetical protein
VLDPFAPSGPRRRTALLAAAVFLFPFALDFWTGRYVGSGDTAPAELLPIALLEQGTLTFNAFVRADEPLPYWFRRSNGRIVSNYPILPGLLNVPTYAGARLAGLPLQEQRFRLSHLTAAALASFSALFLFLALRRVCRSETEAFGFAMLYAAGTEVWSVAGRGLFQHGPSLFLLTLALWLLLEDRSPATALAGLALGFAVVNRPTNLLITAPLAFFVLARRRSGLAGFALLAAVPALLHGAYAAAYWGSPFSMAQTLLPSSPFAGSPVAGLAGLLVSPSRGLFIFSPMSLFAIPAGIAAFRRSADLLDRCLVAGILLTLAVYAHWRVWWGGHSFGYRLLIELLPFLMFLIARFWPEIARSRVSKVTFGVLAAASIAVQLLGVYGYPSGFNENIDRETERLWLVRESEIPRLARGFLADAGLAAAPTPVPATPGPRRSDVPTPVPRWWTAAGNDEMLPAALDWPRPDRVVEGDLHISGWAASRTGPSEVQILISPGDRMIPVARLPREDVCKVIPDLTDCSRIGFSATLASDDRVRREHLIVVEIRTPEGRVRRLGPVRFFWRAREGG